MIAIFRFRSKDFKIKHQMPWHQKDIEEYLFSCMMYLIVIRIYSVTHCKNSFMKTFSYEVFHTIQPKFSYIRQAYG